MTNSKATFKNSNFGGYLSSFRAENTPGRGLFMPTAVLKRFLKNSEKKGNSTKRLFGASNF